MEQPKTNYFKIFTIVLGSGGVVLIGALVFVSFAYFKCANATTTTNCGNNNIPSDGFIPVQTWTPQTTDGVTPTGAVTPTSELTNEVNDSAERTAAIDKIRSVLAVKLNSVAFTKKDVTNELVTINRAKYELLKVNKGIERTYLAENFTITDSGLGFYGEDVKTSYSEGMQLSLLNEMFYDNLEFANGSYAVDIMAVIAKEYRYDGKTTATDAGIVKTTYTFSKKFGEEANTERQVFSFTIGADNKLYKAEMKCITWNIEYSDFEYNKSLGLKLPAVLPENP